MRNSKMGSPVGELAKKNKKQKTKRERKRRSSPDGLRVRFIWFLSSNQRFSNRYGSRYRTLCGNRLKTVSRCDLTDVYLYA